MKTQPESTALRGIVTALALSFGCQQLHAQATDDHGNTSAAATVLTLDAAGGSSTTGGIQATGDLDWFRVMVTSQSTGVFTLIGAPGQTVQIYKAATPATAWKGGGIPAAGTRMALANILPTGTYFAKVAGATGNYTLAFASRVSGDTNADGKADLLWQHTNTGQMSVWHMNGRTKLGEALFATQPAAGWKLVNSGDFNADRMPDLVLQNAANGDVVLWYMNGLAMLSQGPLNIQMGSKLWCVAAVGDMNKDGMLDLLYQNSSTGNVQVRYLNKSRQVTGSGVFPQQLSPEFRLCGTGDVNGDGSPDAIWQNRNTGAVTVTYLDGLALVAGGGGLSAQPSYPWEAAGIEDRNGDGKADILMQYRTTGQTLVWFLSGRTVLTGGGATSVQQASLLFQAKNSRSLFAPPPVGFSLIPAGTFQMGNALSASGDGLDDELPVHAVTVSAFHMAKSEVTMALWDQVRAWGLANGYTDLPAGTGKAANHPVHSTSWFSIAKWCNARSQKEGLSPCYTVGGEVYKIRESEPVCDWTANGYRLPTEAEWEKAARGGLAGKRFPWGDTITHGQANYYSSLSCSYDESQTLGYHPAYETGGTPYTSPAGGFAPNGYGLYDMAGNLSEWCWDRYATYSAGAQTDPRGAGSGTLRVLRGGSWRYNAVNSRVSNRINRYPSNRSDLHGFRLARGMVP